MSRTTPVFVRPDELGRVVAAGGGNVWVTPKPCVSQLNGDFTQALYPLTPAPPAGPSASELRLQPLDILVLGLSESARSLGVAQAKGDDDAIQVWKDRVLNLEQEIRLTYREGRY